MRDIIEIKKDMMPYSFYITLSGEEFKLAFDYNKTADLFTVTLMRDDEVLCYNEPIVYGVELFTDIYISDKFPRIAIVPLDESGEENTVTYENFNETVLLTIDDEPDDDEVET